MSDCLTWLQSYFAENCDGDWEHESGVEITTTDNPGWHVRIDLVGTRFEELAFDDIKEIRTPDDWIILARKNGVLTGSGGRNNLSEVLSRMGVILGYD